MGSVFVELAPSPITRKTTNALASSQTVFARIADRSCPVGLVPFAPASLHLLRVPMVVGFSPCPAVGQLGGFPLGLRGQDGVVGVESTDQIPEQAPGTRSASSSQ